MLARDRGPTFRSIRQPLVSEGPRVSNLLDTLFRAPRRRRPPFARLARHARSRPRTDVQVYATASSIRGASRLEPPRHALSRAAPPARFHLRWSYRGPTEAPLARRRAVRVARSPALALIRGNAQVYETAFPEALTDSILSLSSQVFGQGRPRASAAL